uniref:Putative glycine rich protein n=1 Tax=Ixodes ricinus TaxID=34613 RepID=A0A0K8RFN0_IXORI
MIRNILIAALLIAALCGLAAAQFGYYGGYGRRFGGYGFGRGFGYGGYGRGFYGGYGRGFYGRGFYG